MNNYFYLDESPAYANKYLIRLNHELFPFPHGTAGSYNVLLSRLLGLSYSDYLRYCRDRLGAELIGKNSLYVLPFFDKTAEVLQLIELLNNRMKYIMQERNLNKMKEAYNAQK